MFAATIRRSAPAVARSTAGRFTAVGVAQRGLLSTVSVSSARQTASGRSFVGIAAAGAIAAAAFGYSTAAEVAAAGETGLTPKAFVPLTLAKRIPYNHNTDVFVFALKDKDALLNLPVASFLVTKFIGPDGKEVIRPYTPIDQHIPGELHLMVKNYEKGVMSKHIHELKVGDSLDIKGPMPKFAYVANGKKSIGMIAGGTGITPMLQVAEEILRNPADKTEVTLVFANTSTKDILLKERLDSLAKNHSNFHPIYVIDKPEPGFNGPTGYLNADLLRRFLPKPSADVQVLACGPPGFMTVVSGGKTPDYKQGEVTGALKELGFDTTNVFKL